MLQAVNQSIDLMIPVLHMRCCESNDSPSGGARNVQRLTSRKDGLHKLLLCP